MQESSNRGDFVRLVLEGKSYDYQPYKDGLYKMRMLMRYRSERTFRNVFRFNLTSRFLSSLHDTINPNNKFAQNRNTIISISGETGCQPKHSKVLMSNGEFKEIQNIVVGDKVISFDNDGKSIIAKVIKKLHWVSEENYDICQLNRHKKKLYSCSYNHIIPYMKRRTYRADKKDVRPRKVSWELLELPAKSFANKSNKELCHTTQGLMSPPILDFDSKNCIIEPYSLGVYLSDGTFFRGHRNKNGRKMFMLSITKANTKIIKEINKIYPYHKSYNKKDSPAKAYYWKMGSEFSSHLDRYGLGGKTSAHKFIPKEALASDLEYRKRLLAGLIDGDGSNSNGSYTYTSKSHRLVNDMIHLVHSVGGRVNSIAIINGVIRKYGFMGKYWRIIFFIHENLKIPILTEHKKKIANSYYLRANSCSIIAKKNNKRHLVYGFTLDSPTGYYITDNWMLTHNSGKSQIAMTLGVKYFPNFSHNNIFFFDQQILDNVDKFPENTLLVRDENPAGAIFGVGSQRISSQVGVLSEVSRKAGLNLAFIEPSFAENPIIKIYLQTVDMDLNNRITRLALKDSQTLSYMGALYLKILDEDHKEWILYNRKKDKFIDDVKKGKLGESKQNYDSMVDELLKNLDESYRTKKERKVFIIKEHPSLTNSEIDILATLLEIRLRE